MSMTESHDSHCEYRLWSGPPCGCKCRERWLESRIESLESALKHEQARTVRADALSRLILTSPTTGQSLAIATRPQKQQDASIRFTAISRHGERWGVIVGMTELAPVPR